MFIDERRDSRTETARSVEKINNLPVVLSYRGWALAVIRIPKKQSVYSFGPKALMDGLHMITPLLADVAGVATAANIPAVVIASLLMCIACVVPVTSATDGHAVSMLLLPLSLSTSCCCGLCCCWPVP